MIWKEFKLANGYTVEASSYGFLNAERVTVPFSVDLLLDAGQAIAEGISEYIHLQDGELLEKYKRRIKRKSRQSKPTPKPTNPQDSSLDLPPLEKPHEIDTIDDIVEEIKEELPVIESAELEESDSSDGD